MEYVVRGPVTVPAGQIEATRLDTIRWVPEKGRPQVRTSAGAFSSWWAHGVGLVKQEVYVHGFSSLVHRRLELIEYTPAP